MTNPRPPAPADPWKDVETLYPYSDSPRRNDGPRCYFADDVDAARLATEQQHQQALEQHTARLRAALESLPAQIMNIPRGNVEPDWSGSEQGTYRIGHRDARHAAAELVTSTIAALAASPAPQETDQKQP